MEVDRSSNEANSNTETILVKPKVAASEKNPEAAASEIESPETTASENPEAAASEMENPDAAASEIESPDAAAGEMESPETTASENPEAAASEMENSEASVSEKKPEAAASEIESPETTASEMEIPEKTASEEGNVKVAANKEENLKTIVKEKENHSIELSEQHVNPDCHKNPNLEVKRKRGRPPRKVCEIDGTPIKITREAKEPVRISQRTKNAPEDMSYATTSKMGYMWSEEDKIQLLRGLEEFGHTDLKKLKKYLPLRGIGEIATQIQMWQDIAQNDVQKRLVTEKQKLNSATVNTINKLDDSSFNRFYKIMEVDCSFNKANSNTETILVKPKVAASKKKPEAAASEEGNVKVAANKEENLKTVVKEKENHSIELSEQHGNPDCHENPNLEVKRKRGRPRKVCEIDGTPIKTTREVKLPVRKSLRTKKAPEVMSYTKTGPMRQMWSEEEKIQLLRGLEEFGHTDLKNIRKYLPHRKIIEIATQIRMWQDIAQNDVQKKLVTEKRKLNSATVNTINKLDSWLQYLKNNIDEDSPRLFALSNVFLLISEYADLPPPDKSGGIDFRAMYRFIHSAINGVPFYGVNRKTAEVLQQSISDMFQTLREQNVVKDMQDILNNTTPHTMKPECRTYSRVEKIRSKSGSSDEIWTFPDINPLNIPPESLVKNWEAEQSPLEDWITDDDDDDDEEVVELDD